MNTPIELPANPFASLRDNALASAAAPHTELFSAAELETLAYRRFNPLASLTAQTLSSALDAFSAGILAPAARLWEESPAATKPWPPSKPNARKRRR